MAKNVYQGTTRSRRVTGAESATYREIREQVMQEIPPTKPTAEKVAIAKLRAMRQAKGISLSELAARIGMTRGNLARLESQKNATLRTLQRYADGLDCELQIDVVAADTGKNAKRRATG